MSILTQEQFIKNEGACPVCFNIDFLTQKTVGSLGIDFETELGFQEVKCGCTSFFIVILKIANSDNIIDLGEEIEYKLYGFCYLCDCLSYLSGDDCNCNKKYKNPLNAKYDQYLINRKKFRRIGRNNKKII